MDNEAYGIDSFIEQIPLGILILGDDGSLQASNSRAFRLLDMAVEDALGADFLQAVPALQVREAAARVLEGLASAENFFFERGGISVKCGVSRLEAAEGGVIIILEDVTQFRNMDRIKQDFIQTILHSLRSPLSTLTTSLSMMAGGAIPLGESAAREIIDMSMQEVERLNTLVADLRDLFIIETGLAAQELEFEVFPVGEALRRAVEDIGKAPELAGRIERSGGMELSIRADFEKTKQILRHVLKNACIFTPGNSPISVRAVPAGAGVTIEVRDRGIGIPEGKMNMLFTKFFRDDNEITRQVHGNGLGLYIARSYAGLMGGSIYCESAAGKGSSFFLTLPSGKDGA